MLTIIFHCLFAALLVVLVWASARRDADQERLVKGLDLARKLDAETARAQIARMQEDQRKQHVEMLALLGHAKAVCDASVSAIGDGRTGKGHAPDGHAKGGNLTNWG